MKKQIILKAKSYRELWHIKRILKKGCILKLAAACEAACPLAHTASCYFIAERGLCSEYTYRIKGKTIIIEQKV